jgi:hypothetical protein
MAYCHLVTLFSLLALAIISTEALKCKFMTFDLAPVGSSSQNQQNENEGKEYECPREVFSMFYNIIFLKFSWASVN